MLTTYSTLILVALYYLIEILIEYDKMDLVKYSKTILYTVLLSSMDNQIDKKTLCVVYRA